MCFETYGLQMNSTRRQSLESPYDKSERCRSGGTVAVVSSWGSKWLRNAMYSWRIRESPMNTKWLCFPKNARYCKHLLVSLKNSSFSFNLLCGLCWKWNQTLHSCEKSLRLTVMMHHTAIRLPLLISFVPTIWQKPLAWIYSYGTKMWQLCRDLSEVRDSMNTLLTLNAYRISNGAFHDI